MHKREDFSPSGAPCAGRWRMGFTGRSVLLNMNLHSCHAGDFCHRERTIRPEGCRPLHAYRAKPTRVLPRLSFMNTSFRFFVLILPASAIFVIAGCEEKTPVTALKPKKEAPSALPSQPPAPNTAEVAKENASPSPGLKKIDSQILLALKQVRGEPPFDKPAAFEPDIPVRDGQRVLIDLHAEASGDLLKYIAAIGGEVVSSPDSPGIVRAMIPLTQMEALAGRPDVQSISPTGHPSRGEPIRRIYCSPAPRKQNRRKHLTYFT